MNGPVACTTEYIDSCTHFSLIPNIPCSVVRHVFVYHTGKGGVQSHFADSPCTVQLQGNKTGVTFFQMGDRRSLSIPLLARTELKVLLRKVYLNV